MTPDEKKVIEQAIDALARVEYYYLEKELLAALRSMLEKPDVLLSEKACMQQAVLSDRPRAPVDCAVAVRALEMKP